MVRIARTNKIIVRLTDKEKERLENYAASMGVSMSEIIQDYIKSLPKLKTGNSSTIPCSVNSAN
jgi:antitoxin component of RelBE/YafQ-DinJ toxin-antitoxin module